ncbi:hypothetical protein HZB96_03545 [Candidatus Gottesmanbacteria bacterium]|nr:hypothetical protein [Candidatus Gottesmanbacteria bacterium]
MALPKYISWPILILLVFLDASVTHITTKENTLLWRPLIEKFGVNILWVLAIVGLILFYLITKIGGWYVERVGRLPKGEEIVLTSLLIVFATYDTYKIFIRPSLDYLNPSNYYFIFPVLLLPVIIYSLWLEHHKHKKVQLVHKHRKE